LLYTFGSAVWSISATDTSKHLNFKIERNPTSTIPPAPRPTQLGRGLLAHFSETSESVEISIELNGIVPHQTLGRLCVIVTTADEDPSLSHSSCLSHDSTVGIGRTQEPAQFILSHPSNFMSIEARVVDSTGETRSVVGKLGAVEAGKQGLSPGTMLKKITQ
jgi:hypothetical protein